MIKNTKPQFVAIFFYFYRAMYFTSKILQFTSYAIKRLKGSMFVFVTYECMQEKLKEIVGKVIVLLINHDM